MARTHGTKTRQASHRRQNPTNANASLTEQSLVPEHEASLSLQTMHISEETDDQPLTTGHTEIVPHSMANNSFWQSQQFIKFTIGTHMQSSGTMDDLPTQQNFPNNLEAGILFFLCQFMFLHSFARLYNIYWVH